MRASVRCDGAVAFGRIALHELADARGLGPHRFGELAVDDDRARRRNLHGLVQQGRGSAGGGGDFGKCDRDEGRGGQTGQGAFHGCSGVFASNTVAVTDKREARPSFSSARHEL